MRGEAQDHDIEAAPSLGSEQKRVFLSRHQLASSKLKRATDAAAPSPSADLLTRWLALHLIEKTKDSRPAAASCPKGVPRPQNRRARMTEQNLACSAQNRARDNHGEKGQGEPWATHYRTFPNVCEDPTNCIASEEGRRLLRLERES